MKTNRLQVGNLLTEATNFVLFISMFAPWYRGQFGAGPTGSFSMEERSISGFGAGGFRFVVPVLCIAVIGTALLSASGLLERITVQTWLIFIAGAAGEVVVMTIAYANKPELRLGPGARPSWGLYMAAAAAVAALGAAIVSALSGESQAEAEPSSAVARARPSLPPVGKSLVGGAAAATSPRDPASGPGQGQPPER